MSLDNRDLELIRATARETSQETARTLGFDPDNPQEAQEIMAFLRDMKAARDTVVSTAAKAIVTTLVIGVLGLVAIGAKARWFSGAGP